ncbi:MAG: hypothetical protein ABEJ31_02120 [Haloarculaceae archaeon]
MTTLVRITRSVDGQPRPRGRALPSALGFAPGAHKRNTVLALTYLLLALLVLGRLRALL